MARTTKIPTYDRQVGMSDQGIRGFSGGEIAQASDTGLESLGRGMVNLSGSLANIEKDRMRKEATLWVSENYEDLHQKYVKREVELQNEVYYLDKKIDVLVDSGEILDEISRTLENRIFNIIEGNFILPPNFYPDI